MTPTSIAQLAGWREGEGFGGVDTSTDLGDQERGTGWPDVFFGIAYFVL